jgi:hypothetical protein
MMWTTLASPLGVTSPCGINEGHGHQVNAGDEPRLKAGAQRTLEGVGSGPWFGGCLQPATHRSLIG